MRDVVIQASSLSKLYRIGARQPQYGTLRDTLSGFVSTRFARLRSPHRTPRDASASVIDTLWALKDVSFEVARGEVVGIIGSNGAGKSTLLKILSRITEPTEGRVEIRGRVGSLLEIGTGFHPELTGRENIFLNGAILGMRKPEIVRKFDEIVAFAELEKFIDTPVKRYSSGMYVRLAFAVAAHMDPEILLVDEVLSVGDLAFQRKCIETMSAVAGAGRTVLFVSHNLPSVLRLCSCGIWLRGGAVAEQGPVQDVIAHYQAEVSRQNQSGDAASGLASGRRKRLSDDLVLQGCALQSRSGHSVSGLPYRSGCQVVVRAKCNRERIKRAAMYVWVNPESSDQKLFVLSSGELDVGSNQAGDSIEVRFQLPDIRLMPGVYQMSVGCKVGGAWSDVAYGVQTFQVQGEDELVQEWGSDFAPVSMDYEAISKVLAANEGV